MLANFNEKSQKLIAIAESIAFDLGHSSVGCEHLLLSFLKIRDTRLKILFEKEGVTYEILKEEIVNLFGKKEGLPFYMEYTPALKKVIDEAIELSKGYNEERVSVDCLAFSLISCADSLTKELVSTQGIDLETIKEQLKITRISPLDSVDELVNLNKKAIKEPVVLIDREDDLQLVINCLLRRQKPNALIVGEPGVGKSASVEYLAQKIVNKDIDDSLKDMVVYELDISAIVAGTKYRGEFEEKLKKIIKKIRKEPSAIIFIDEIHNIIGAGGAEGAIDASNILKPYLARGDFKCIGATTYEEYVKLVKKEKAIDRRFQLIKLDEPGLEKTIKILKGIKHQYENFHGVEIDDNICEKIVKYAKKHVVDRHFPDKAIDIMDCSCVSVKKEKRKKLDEKTVIQTIEKLYKVEINNSNNKLEYMNKKIKEKIIGQDAVIKQISRHLSYIDKGLCDEGKPLGVYFFVGPSGYGKTQTAKEIAKLYFGSYDNYIKIDMSEYSEPSSVTKLIGSPPGYVGHDNQTYIVDSIRKNPHSVIILDEIEKANKEVVNIFLNVFDEGYFFDARKRKIDFSNALIILTSNLGYSEETFIQKKIGFINTKDEHEEGLKAIREHFRSEFLNRIDELFCFNRLNEESARIIGTNYLSEYQDKMDYEFSSELILEEVMKSKDEILRYGARQLKRDIKKKNNPRT